MKLKIQVVLGETGENYEFTHSQRHNILHLTQSLFINRINYMFRLICSHSRADLKKDKVFTPAAVIIFPLLFTFIHFRDRSGDRDESPSEFPVPEKLIIRTSFEIRASKLEGLMLTSRRRY